MPKTLETLSATTAPALDTKLLVRRNGQTTDESTLLSYIKSLVNTSVAVSGGTIDGATIGGTTPAAATVTDLTATGTTTIGAGTGVAKLTTGVVSAGSVDLTSEVTGALPVLNGGTGATTASGARTNLGLGSAAVENTSAFLQPANNLSDVAVASTARTNLGLGSIATQAANSVAITGGSISGITDLAVADGGTGASTAADARTNLGLVIGTDIQAQNANLQGIADATVGSNEIVYKDGANNWYGSSISAFGRSLIDDSNASTARSTLGLGDMAEQTSSSVSITGGSISGITDLAVADGGTGASTAGGARTNLGLGTIATQDANNVSISGGAISGISDLAIADGGTGASTASGARTNLGLGTAATLNVGTSADNVVQLDGSARLPAVDGSQLTNLPASPTASVIAFAGSSAPSGWLLCYGQAVSRTTYADLFTAIGTTYGSGDGSTTFNLPDLRGRAVFGKDDMGASAANRITSGVSGITGTTLGASGGDQNMAQHNHGVTDPGHYHVQGFYWNSTAGTRYGYEDGGASSSYFDSGSGGTGNVGAKTQTKTTGVTVNNEGSGSSANVPPALILNYIIKT